MRPTYLLLALATAVLGLMPTLASATILTMENVFNRAPGSGPAQPDEPFFAFGLCQPDNINPGDGQPFATACAPGTTGRYPAGFPRDEPLVNDLRVYNNTPYSITSLTLQIVGLVDEPEPFNFTITLEPNVSAFWVTPTGTAKSACRTSSTRLPCRRTIAPSRSAAVSFPSAVVSPTSSSR